MKKFLLIGLCALFALGTMIGCSGSKEKASAGDTGNKKYRIALSNAYLGNDWRQVMLRTTEVVAGKAPYKDKVELTIVNSESSPEAQAASIDVLVEQGYDAILVNASSPTALNPSIDRALAAGIVVIAFDNVVEHPTVHKIYRDEYKNGTGWATFIASQLKPGDTVAIDTGRSGTTVGNNIYNAAVEVFDKAGIRVVAEFASEWSDGVGQQQLASVLAANPDIDGVLFQAYAETIEAAFTQAGKPFTIPCSGNLTNAGQLAALKHNMNFVASIDPPGLGANALEMAVKILEGEEVERDIPLTPQFFAIPQYASIDIGFPITRIEKDVTCFDGRPGALPWPVLTPGFQPDVTVEEIADYKR
jgi:ribose transport system substrate-binding protein